MISTLFLLVVGTVCICYQGLAGSASVCYIGELMVESNTSMEASIVMSVLTSTIQVNNSKTLSLQESKLVSECLHFGDSSNCSCSAGYMWTSDMCNTQGCVRGAVCTISKLQNISFCIPEVGVRITGSVIMAGILSGAQQSMVVNALRQLSPCLEGVNFSSSAAEFETVVSVKAKVSTFHEMATSLARNLGHDLKIEGLAEIESPPKILQHYNSTVHFSCSIDTDTAREDRTWHLYKNLTATILNNGSVVTLDDHCATQGNYCTALNLKAVTGVWAGTYECHFVIGPVMYTAKAKIDVALLPDEINMEINPITVDCAKSSNVSVKATIASTSEPYVVTWDSNSLTELTDRKNTTSPEFIVYSVMAHINCDQTTTEAQFVNISFKNQVKQEKTEQYTIPVIYETSKFCTEDKSNGQIWPKTPDGTTLINRICEDNNTVGYTSRTCEHSKWQPVYDYCVKKELSEILTAADNFKKGLGSSQDMAKHVFEGLKNNTDSETTKSTANVFAVVDVLDVLSTASDTFEITEEVLPNFVESASNILTNKWQNVKDSDIQKMSSTFLQSVEGLVKNIKVKTTRDISETNIKFQICSDDCDTMVLGINVNLYNGTKVVKSVGVKNLIDKLQNNYRDSQQLSDKIIIVTQEDDSSSNFKILLDFPNKPPELFEPLCVYWDTNKKQWSREGCDVSSSINNDGTLCVCDHLTAFSILMGKRNTPDPNLDVITYVGLAVSICSLIIFLIIEYLVWSVVVKSNLSHFRHTAMVNIATFRLLADCSFLASSSPDILPDEWCLILTICKHVFYLAMFSWMLCLSGMLVHQLIFVFSPLRKRVFMFFSSIVGYVCPILLVGASYLFCKYTKTQYYDPKSCWLVYDGLLQGSLYAFLLPIGTITLTNLFSMVVVILTLMKTSVPGGDKAKDKETAKSIFKVVLYLTPVFGITWAFGFLLRILGLDDPVYPFAEYIFTILNTFQGLFILITGCFTEPKVREELIARITGKKKKANITQNQTSNSCANTK